MESLLVGGVGFALGWLLCRAAWKGRYSSILSIARRLNSDVDDAEMRYLEGLRRELANEIMTDDTSAMYRAFHKMQKYELDLRQADKQRIDAGFKSLCSKYPAFADFEPFGTMHFVAYRDARWALDTCHLIEVYCDISQMLIINSVQKGRLAKVFSERESKQLDKVIIKCKDRAFEKRLIQAMEYYNVYRRAHGPSIREGVDVYSDGVVSVRPVSIKCGDEIGYGIYFLDTDEYGLHTIYHDHEREKYCRSYYRSDSTFSEWQPLDS